MLNKFLKKTLISVFFIVFNLLNTATATLVESCPNLSLINPSEVHAGIVDWVPDGDTIHTRAGKKLRLLHINTPEIHPNSNKSAEPFAKKARKRLIELIGSSKKVYWVNDKRQKDKYKRELAFVFNSEGRFLNAQLAAEGMAHTLVILPNQKYWRCIVLAEKQAYKANIGIWNHAKFRAKTSKEIKANQGFQLVTGKITQIVNSKKNRWLILDDYLWVGIPRKNFKNFDQGKLDFKTGERITVRGYVYHSHKKLRLKLKHPSMIFE